MPDELKLHILSRREVAAGSLYSSWDESVCAARPTEGKLRALLSNPLLHSEDEPMQVIGTRTHVIGRIDLVAGDLVADGRPVPILWGSAFFVPEAERKSMMGAMLLMKAQTAFHTLGANGPSQLASPLYEKLKWSAVPLQRWIGLRRSRSIVERYMGSGPAAHLVNLGGDAALGALNAVNAARRALAARALRVRRLDSMPAEFDARLTADGNAPAPAVRGHRSAAWINWLLASRFEPQKRHERALFLIESPRGDPLGCFLIKVKFHPVATHRAFPNLTLATLADSMIFDPARLPPRTLTMLAAREAWRLGAEALEVCAPPADDPLGFRSMGFIPAGRMTCYWRAVKPSPLADERYKNPDAWRIRYADGESVPG